MCLHYSSDKQLLILTDKGLCFYNSSSLFLYGFLWVVLGDRSFITSQVGGGGVSEGGYHFLRGLIFGDQFLKCTECERGRNIKTQDLPYNVKFVKLYHD